VSTRRGRESPSTPSRIGRALEGRRLRVKTPSKSVESLSFATQSLRVTRNEIEVDLSPTLYCCEVVLDPLQTRKRMERRGISRRRVRSDPVEGKRFRPAKGDETRRSLKK
jgi:hypothetical protein